MAIWPRSNDDARSVPKGDWCLIGERREALKDRCHKCGSALVEKAA